jgi:D-3-phosphoglycerate dehydrogenase
MFALARQIPEASGSTKAGKWEKNRFMGVELTAKTLGLIGCGNIGSIVADRAVGLKMRVLAYDPYLSEKKALDLGVEKTDLDTLLARADFITLHTPLTDATRNILSREALAKTKKGVRIINCARGGLVDEAALADAIKSGHIAGAALDVFEIEPATDSPLFGLENVVCTNERFPADRCGYQRHQHGLRLRRGRPPPQTLPRTLPPAGWLRRPTDPGQGRRAAQGLDRV